MTEKDLQDLVLELAARLRLHAYHTFDSRRSAPGFPDLIIAGPGGHLFAELKSAGGKLSPEQVDWKYALSAAGATYRVWYPHHWETGEIHFELRMLR